MNVVYIITIACVVLFFIATHFMDSKKKKHTDKLQPGGCWSKIITIIFFLIILGFIIINFHDCSTTFREQPEYSHSDFFLKP